MRNIKCLSQSLRSRGGLGCLVIPKVKLACDYGRVLWRTEPQLVKPDFNSSVRIVPQYTQRRGTRVINYFLNILKLI